MSSGNDYPQPDPLPPPLPIFNHINWPQIEVDGAGGGGFQGFQGVQGFQGFQGFQGVQGLQGLQGVQGVQGVQGSLAVGTEVNTTTIADFAGTVGQGLYGVAVGYDAGKFYQDVESVAIGYQAGHTAQGADSVAIGMNAAFRNQESSAVAIGNNAGQNFQGQFAVAMGLNAGLTGQVGGSVAIGRGAGQSSQGGSAVAIGSGAGQRFQGAGAVAIGLSAGNTGQGTNAIAIGNVAGETNQPANSIVMNARGTALDPGTTGFFVAPVRLNATTTPSTGLFYDNATGEIVYAPTTGAAGNNLTLSCTSFTTNATIWTYQPITWSAVTSAFSSATFNDWSWTSGSNLTCPASGRYSFSVSVEAVLSDPIFNIGMDVNGRKRFGAASSAITVVGNTGGASTSFSTVAYLDAGDIVQFGICASFTSNSLGIDVSNPLYLEIFYMGS